MIARPARARVVGEVEERRVAVDEVSAACSVARRVSWESANVRGLRGFEAIMDYGVGVIGSSVEYLWWMDKWELGRRYAVLAEKAAG